MSAYLPQNIKAAGSTGAASGAFGGAARGKLENFSGRGPQRRAGRAQERARKKKPLALRPRSSAAAQALASSPRPNPSAAASP